ncbi:uncharacterized protein METZ01_LOCUS448543, partial [marine metagenome]
MVSACLFSDLIFLSLGFEGDNDCL